MTTKAESAELLEASSPGPEGMRPPQLFQAEAGRAEAGRE